MLGNCDKFLPILAQPLLRLGQALSTRTDLICPDLLEELIKLQDQFPPFKNKETFAIIEKCLSRTLGEVYRRISASSVVTASLG